MFDAVWSVPSHGNPEALAEEIARWTERGVPVMPYLTFTQPHYVEHDPYNGWSFKDHPDWIAIDKNGEYNGSSFASWPEQVRRAHAREDLRRGFRSDMRVLEFKLPSIFATCVNNAEFIEHMMGVLRMLMEAGAAGFFIDNIHGQPACYGPEHGKHEHIYPDDLADELGDEWKLPVEYMDRAWQPAESDRWPQS